MLFSIHRQLYLTNQAEMAVNWIHAAIDEKNLDRK
jgi:hypothetical protein